MIEEEVNRIEKEGDADDDDNDDADDDENIDDAPPAKILQDTMSNFMSRLQMMQKGPKGAGSTGTPPLISRISAPNRQVIQTSIFSPRVECP